MKRSESINEIAKALAAAQREMKPASKDAKNPFFKSNYADLSSIWESIREPVNSREIAVLQEAVSVQTGVQVTTLLLHSSGQWIEFEPFLVPVSKQDAQGIGSATSYCKRYALCAALGIVTGEADDDGNAACSKSEKKQEPKPSTITKQQAKEFQSIISECQPEYIKWLTDEMKKSGFNSVENLPVEWYDNILKQTIENRDAFKARVKTDDGSRRTLGADN